MKGKLYISFAKFIILTAILVLATASVKIWLGKDTLAHLKRYTEDGHGYPKVYFVGSSRTRAGILTDTLQKLEERARYYNLGLARGSILYSTKLAEKVVEIAPQKSVIYVELSDFSVTAPVQTPFFYSLSDWLSIVRTHASLRKFSFEEMDALLLIFFNIRTEIKNAIVDEQVIWKEFAYEVGESGLKGGKEAIVSRRDIENAPGELTVFQKGYLGLLQDLVKKGKEKQVKVKFVLTPVIGKASERAQTLAIYKQLPDKDKLVYSKGFLEKLKSDAFVTDINHLNLRGAYLNTLEIRGDIAQEM